MPLATPPTSSIPLYARNKDTGETFLIGPPVSMIDDLGDVDTSTTGPTGGQALIWDATLGQWIPGQAGVPLSTDADNAIFLGTDGGLYSNEIHLGPTGPTLAGPEIWADPEAGTIYAAATGPTGATEWVPVGGSEVEVDAVEPVNDWELWVDTSAAAPAAPPTTPLALDDLTDVDTTAVAPIDGDGLVFTGGVWAPATPGAPPALDFLPLDGSVPMAGAIQWPATTGNKLLLYPTAGSAFGIGIESGTLSLFVDQAANKVSFKIGGTERAFVDQNGLGPRSTINVSYLNGFTGSTSFRVTPATVTLAMMNVVNANDIYGFGEMQVCALPAGVPAPFATVSASGATYIGSSVTLHFRVEVRSTGVYIMTLADNILAGDLTCSVSLTYSR